MINLLPPIEKQKLSSEKKEKLIIIFGIVFLVALICLTLILLSIKFYVLAETDYQKDLLEQNRKVNQTSEFISLNNTIQKYNAILAQVNSFYKKEIYLNQALDIITKISKPEGVYLEDFSLNRDKNGVIKIDISGTGDTRDSLLIFKKNIEADKNILNPSFSTESWTSPKNAKFSLTLTIVQNEK